MAKLPTGCFSLNIYTERGSASSSYGRGGGSHLLNSGWGMWVQNEASRPTPSSALVADWVLSGTAENQCTVPAKDRVDCGYPQVTPEQCNSRGCCFDSSIPEVPWCFKPLQESGKSAPRAPGPSWACDGTSRSPGRPGSWDLGRTPRAMAVRWWRPQSEASSSGYSAASGCPLLSCC